MTESWEGGWERSERKHRELQDRILTIPGTQRTLRQLTKEGANQGEVLSLLASTTTNKDFWQKAVRRKKNELESIGNQLDTVANHAQRLALETLSYSGLWLALLGLGKWEDVKPAKAFAPMYVFELMRAYAKNCRERAKFFGSLLRQQPPRQRRSMIDCLLLEIWHRTRKYHDKEIALLLTNASEAAGHKREFTEDQVKKHRQRYVMPRIESYRRSHSENPAANPVKGTSPTPDSFRRVP